MYVERNARRHEATSEAAFPPTGRFVELDGRRIHVHMQGSGPDLVLLHGAYGNLRDYTFDLAGRLAGDFRVIAFDRPGLGWSDAMGDAGISPIAQADALRAAAAQLGVRRPIVLGHSYGGAVAMAWALRAPADTAAVVLLAGATHPWPGELTPWYQISASGFGQSVVIPAITAFATDNRAEAVVRDIFAPQTPPPGYDDFVGVGLSLRRESLRLNARQVNMLKAYLERMAPGYPQLSMPIELLHGAEDRTVGLREHSRRMEAEVKSANLTVLEGVGHMPHHADPEAAVAAIRRAASRAGLR